MTDFIDGVKELQPSMRPSLVRILQRESEAFKPKIDHLAALEGLMQLIEMQSLDADPAETEPIEVSLTGHTSGLPSGIVAGVFPSKLHARAMAGELGAAFEEAPAAGICTCDSLPYGGTLDQGEVKLELIGPAATITVSLRFRKEIPDVSF